MGGMFLDNEGFNRLDYSEEFPQNWSKLLSELKDSGVRRFRSSVYWGAHERTKGFRDFTASSRLKLEKFLKLAHDQQLEVDIGVGFRPGAETFPAWTFQSPNRCSIPTCAWSGVFSGNSLTEIPSLEDSEVGAGFADFLRETLSLLSLYRAPEGPVTSVTLDLRLYHLTLNAMEGASFPAALRARYSTIHQFNQIYGVSFRDFESLSSPNAMRTLLEKRAWLAAFDYKWCHEKVLSRRIEALTQPLRESGLNWNLQLASENLLATSAGDTEVWVDGMLSLETHNGLFPFAPSKRAEGPSVASTRFCDFMKFHAQDKEISLTLLTTPFPQTKPAKQNVIVFASRFFSRAHAEVLNEHLRGGGNVTFANELPQYDEALESLQWEKSVRTESLPLDDQLWPALQQRFSSGELPL